MLRIEGLNQFYGGSHTLRDVTLEVAIGEVTTLLGRNGMGKTTLLKCLMGLLPVKSGRILFNDLDLGRLRPSQRAASKPEFTPQ